MLLLCWLLIGLALGGSPDGAAIEDALQAPRDLTVRYLRPREFAAAPDVPRRGRLVNEKGVPAAGNEVLWAFVRVAGMQENREGLEIDDGWWVFPTPEPLPGAPEAAGAGAVGVLGVDFEPRVVEVPADSLRMFVKERGAAEQGEALPRGVMRVERVESFKAIVRYGGGATARLAHRPSEATSKTGQQVEIRPLMDPALTPPGSDLALRAYVRGSSAAGAVVRALHVPTGEVQVVQCADTGIGLLSIAAAGEWRLELHALRREKPAEEEPGEAKWVLYSGTLVFETPRVGPDAEVRP